MENKHKIPNRFFIFGAALVWRLKTHDGWNFSLSQRLQFSCIRSSFSFQSSFTRTLGCWQLGGIGETTRAKLDIFSRIPRRSSRWHIERMSRWNCTVWRPTTKRAVVRICCELLVISWNFDSIAIADHFQTQFGDGRSRANDGWTGFVEC